MSHFAGLSVLLAVEKMETRRTRKPRKRRWRILSVQRQTPAIDWTRQRCPQRPLMNFEVGVFGENENFANGVNPLQLACKEEARGLCELPILARRQAWRSPQNKVPFLSAVQVRGESTSLCVVRYGAPSPNRTQCCDTGKKVTQNELQAT